MKTRLGLFFRASRPYRRASSYQVPEIIACPSAPAAAPYLDWIRESTKPDWVVVVIA